MGARVEMDEGRSGAGECTSSAQAEASRAVPERGRGLRRGVSKSLVEEARNARLTALEPGGEHIVLANGRVRQAHATACRRTQRGGYQNLNMQGRPRLSASPARDGRRARAERARAHCEIAKKDKGVNRRSSASTANLESGGFHPMLSPEDVVERTPSEVVLTRNGG
jgi:hypothetical protein